MNQIGAVNQHMKIKVIYKGLSEDQAYQVVWKDHVFDYSPQCQDYDWILVYDEFPKNSVGSVQNQEEVLNCPPEQTILVTTEPPTIKLYPSFYTHQFGYVLTTHEQSELPHPNYRLGQGCLLWFYSKTMEELRSYPEMPKSKILSTVCSSKQQGHTLHGKRYQLTKYLADRLPELDWYGHGVRWLDKKDDGLDDYKYHISIENYCAPHHWTEKLADPILPLALNFYAGDPKAHECLPEGSFIPIPLDDPEAAYQIIRDAIDQNAYEKALPALKEARKLLLEKYNLYAQVVQVIENHEKTYNKAHVLKHRSIKGRHRLRKRPLNALKALWGQVRFRLK